MTERKDQPEDIEFPGFDLDRTDRPRESLGRCNCHLGIKCSIHDRPQADTPRTVEEWVNKLTTKLLAGEIIVSDIRHTLEEVAKGATRAQMKKEVKRILQRARQVYTEDDLKAAEERGEAQAMEAERTRHGARSFIASKALEAVDQIAGITRHACAKEVRTLGCTCERYDHDPTEKWCPIAIADRLEKGALPMT